MQQPARGLAVNLVLGPIGVIGGNLATDGIARKMPEAKRDGVALGFGLITEYRGHFWLDNFHNERLIAKVLGNWI
jgi:hypothetical protein